MASLWSTISTRRAENVERRDRWLKLSQDHPLTIIAAHHYDFDALLALVPFIERWGKLQVTARNPQQLSRCLSVFSAHPSLPRITSLSLTNRSFNGTSAASTIVNTVLSGMHMPSLQELTLVHCVPSAGISSTFSTITSLDLSFGTPTVEELSHILRHAPYLQTLCMNVRGFPNPWITHPPARATSYSVTSLKMSFSGLAESPTYLDHLSFPRLQTLGFALDDLQGQIQEQYVTRLLAGSFNLPHISALHLTGLDETSRASVSRIFDRSPCVISLYLNSLTAIDTLLDNIIQASDTDTPLNFPALQLLDVGSCEGIEAIEIWNGRALQPRAMQRFLWHTPEYGARPDAEDLTWL